MKYIILIILFLTGFYNTPGQNPNGGTFLQTKSKSHFHYVELGKSMAKVYKIGGYYDNAGKGYSIIRIDTLMKQSNESYVGNHTKIIRENNKYYLMTEQKKTKKYIIDTVKNTETVNRNLNNGYYLDQYFKMSSDLNKTYSLNHHSFRNGFYTWDDLINKDVDHSLFREFTDKRIKYIRDSIRAQQDKYITRTNYLLDNLKSIDYNTLKDSLTQLPADYKGKSWYYGTVVNEMAKQRPAYFFRLAEDFPEHQSLIFMAVDDNTEVIEGLHAVDGHYGIKKRFFKERRFGKTMPYRVIGVYVVTGILIWLAVSQ